MFKPVVFAAFVAIAAALPQRLASRAGGPTVYNVHPVSNGNKCVGIVGGVYANGTQVDMYVFSSYVMTRANWISYDCNGSASQQWQWDGVNETSLTSYDSATGARYCLDAGNVDEREYTYSPLPLA